MLNDRSDVNAKDVSCDWEMYRVWMKEGETMRLIDDYELEER